MPRLSSGESEDEATDRLGEPTRDKRSSGPAGLYSEEDTSDSDSAPEDIGFTSSRQNALQKVKDTLKQISDTKRTAKQRKQQKDQLYKEQKQKRLDVLARNRLSEDFLDDLPSEPVAKKSKKSKQKKGKKDEAPVESSEGSTEASQEPAASDSEDEGSVSGQEDYLPLYGNPLTAVTLPDYLKKPKSSQKEAEEFRRKQLYGGKVKRRAVADILRKKQKWSYVGHS